VHAHIHDVPDAAITEDLSAVDSVTMAASHRECRLCTWPAMVLQSKGGDLAAPDISGQPSRPGSGSR
jgi:hypothetical protein